MRHFDSIIYKYNLNYKLVDQDDPMLCTFSENTNQLFNISD